MKKKGHQHTFVCDRCGNEADIIIAEEATSLAEHEPAPKPRKKIMVCKVCGNEADMILEEQEVEEP